MYAKPRLPDSVRSAAVRALVIVAVTLVQLMVAVLCSLAKVWLAFPMVISTVASTVVATWAVLDVWVTRQVWRQRHGVLSEPSSAARERAVEKARARTKQAEHHNGRNPRARTRGEHVNDRGR
ncbi:hypothetical protein [Streptomyces bathyalis]|uniref:hypothetical protein n=1 Tax=Streptomyces bathyalis TaxID=2710756 RepID=UPI0024834873|nr:hypothetical protein [Streptomyces bathyalis]